MDVRLNSSIILGRKAKCWNNCCRRLAACLFKQVITILEMHPRDEVPRLINHVIRSRWYAMRAYKRAMFAETV